MNCVVAAHDAGGAELVSSWVSRTAGHEIAALLNGPALEVFARKLPAMRMLHSSEVEGAIAAADFVLTGTSAESHIEHQVIKKCNERGVRVAAFLDYWFGYRDRFVRDGICVLPDELWVGDEYAQAIAYEAFPGATIVLCPNPYLLDLEEEIRTRRESNPVPIGRESACTRVVYLCQPFDDEYPDGAGDIRRITDSDALEFFLDLLSGWASKGSLAEIRTRLHPAEKPGKYRAAIERYETKLNIAVSRSTLIDDCIWADWAVGTHTMALVVGLTAGVKTFHCIPPGGRPCVLPHKEITGFREYLAT
jgi:hypothetical protein